MKIRPVLWGFRTLLILIYLKVFHKAKGWKYFFGSWGVFRINKGQVSLSPGVWIESDSLCHCEGGNISIGKCTYINRLVTIVSRVNIEIGCEVLIADNVSIYDHDHQILNSELPYGIQGYNSKSIVIEDNVWVGSHSVILKGVTIGKNAIIAAGSVVNRSVPSAELWGGVPAKFIKKLN